MNNKNLIAAIAATTLSTASMASVYLNGTYEGTATDGNPGAATFAQDLDLTLVGSNDAGTNVTMIMENLTGGSDVTATQVFVESSIEGISFKGGNYKGQNGAGLMQKKGAVTNQFEVGFDAAGTGVTIAQASGDGNATVDASLDLAGVSIKAQDVAESTRYVTASTTVGGLEVNVERQATTTGTNTAGSIGATVAGLNVTGVLIDVNDATGVTQDDGILGDVSDANNGKQVKGVVVSTDTTLGLVTGKYVTKNELDTYVAEVERGVWTFGHSKTENADGVTTAKIKVTF